MAYSYTPTGERKRQLDALYAVLVPKGDVPFSWVLDYCIERATLDASTTVALGFEAYVAIRRRSGHRADCVCTWCSQSVGEK